MNGPFRYTLVRLGLFVALLAIPLAILSAKLHRAGKQRKAAEFVRELGGVVRYDYQAKSVNDGPPVPQWLLSLLGIDFFQEIHTVFFDRLDGVATKPFTDEDLVFLKELPELRSLGLQSPYLTDRGLAPLKHLESLETLRVYGSIRGEGLIDLANLRNLEALEIVNCFTPDGELAGNLIQRPLPVTDFRGLAYLRRLPRLRRLHIAVSAEEHLRCLGGIRGLTELRLGFAAPDISGAPLSRMAARDTLASLRLFGAVSGDHVEHLAGFLNLKILNLSRTEISGHDLKKLPRLPKLVFLDLSGTKLAEDDLRNLPELPNLTTLYVQETAIGDTSLRCLSRLPNLRELDIAFTNISSSRIDALRKESPSLDVWD